MDNPEAWAKGFKLAADYGMTFLLALAAVVLGVRWAWIRLGKWQGEAVTVPQVLVAPPAPVPGQTTTCIACPYRRAHEDRWEAVDLLRHRFWRWMDHAQDVTIPTLPIREPGRKALATDFLTLKFRYASNRLRDFVERPDLETMSAVDLEDGLATAIQLCVEDYEGEALRLALARGGSEAMGVFLQRFRLIHQPVVNQVLDYVVGTCQSAWLGDNVTKVAAVLDYLVSIFQRTLVDGERTLGRLNGSLSGLTYAGLVIGPCPESISQEPTRPTLEAL